jgi:FkbM family methyltransferase
MRRAKSLIKYIALFKNWWWAAFARYLKRWLGEERALFFRDGRNLIFRPASDSVAMGEVFIPESYSPCLGIRDLRLAWDIGGNIGCFVIWAARHYPAAQFESFEPCYDTWIILKRNAEANPAIHWKVNPFGFSNRDETVEGYVPDGKFGETSRFASAGKRVALPLRAINSVWRERGCPKIDLLKIDCEGGEYDIFEGIDQQLLECIGFLIMEIHAVPGKDARSIRSALERSGFEVRWPDGQQGMVWASRHI